MDRQDEDSIRKKITQEFDRQAQSRERRDDRAADVRGPPPSSSMSGQRRPGDDLPNDRGAPRPRHDPPPQWRGQGGGGGGGGGGDGGRSSGSVPIRTDRVQTNFVKLSVAKTLRVTQYDVSFSKEIKSNEGKVEAVHAASVMDLLSAHPGAGWCFDGEKILYASAPLTLPASNGNGGSHWCADGQYLQGTAFAGSGRQVYVKLKEAATLDYADFATSSSDRAKLAVLDIAFKHYGSTPVAYGGPGFLMLSDSCFDERKERAWARGGKDVGREGLFEMWRGSRRAIVMTASGPMLQLDTAARVMLKGLPLVDFAAKLAKKPPAALGLADCTKLDRFVRTSTIRWSIKSRHLSRAYKLRGIDGVRCDESMFPLDEGAEGGGRSVSVFDYFKDKYPQFELRRPDLPSVLVGPANDPHRIRLPLELCAIVAGQPAPVTPEIQADMIKETAAPPDRRFADIEAMHKDLLVDVDKGADATPAAFAVDVGRQLVVANATLLSSPTLQYRAPRQGPLVDVIPNTRGGDWNLRGNGGGDLGFVSGGKVYAGGGFAVVKFEQCRDDGLNKFLGMLQRMASERGIDMGRQVGRTIDLSRVASQGGDRIEAELKREVQQLRHSTGDVGLVLCVIGDKEAINARELYPAIKRWSHVKESIPTQCVQAFKATVKMSTSAPYAAGLLLKINLKLGGVNVICKPGGEKPALGLLAEEPTLVLGFDVNHPQPGSTKPSYSALVALLDDQCSAPYTVVGVQRSRDEIAGFVDKVRRCLRAYHERHKFPPKRILFYRDGVAHNQFAAVKEREIAEIFEACAAEGGADYVPKLTFLVVQQRTRARFATVNGKQQLSPGTIIHSDVVGADGNDWYMVSQKGLKGTARPTHYHILHNDVGTSPEELQRLTFELCHLYARATKIVSRPSVVYYAHRAAFLAQYYKDGFKEDNLWEVGSTSSNGSNASNGSVHSIDLGLSTANTVYFA